MTDLVAQLVGALDRLLNSDPDGAIATASDDDLTLAANDMEADPVIREQAEAVLQARAALSAAKDGGWVAVPVEPTKEMIDRACADHGFPGGSRWIYRDGYKSMLAARPLPNPPKGEV